MGARDVTNFRRHTSYFHAARDGFAAFLAEYPGHTVLLPSYIGHSDREGSGVFDPVRTTNSRHNFYALNADLSVDHESLADVVGRTERPIVLLIHYFGRYCSGTSAVAERVRVAGGLLVEDWAHALFAPFLGLVPLTGEAHIFSLHKALPLSRGGLLLHDLPQLESSGDETAGLSLLDYDLARIARRRTDNFHALREALLQLGDTHPYIMLWPDLDEHDVPQTFPVVVQSGRDDLYHALNARGIGATSLYHTMIPVLRERSTDFPSTTDTSSRILNLPIHQDLHPEEMPHIAQAFVEELSR